jgi:nucleoside-diphosphate-sugar epimerase
MHVTVTGGASFIGSHLVDRLLQENHDISIIDNMSSGDYSNISSKDIHVMVQDLTKISPDILAVLLMDSDIVFHLAADHGGRGYVETRQFDCSANFAIDQIVFRACSIAQIPKIVFASSGCVYPLYLQNDTGKLLYLREEDVGPPFEPDGLYGAAKLVAEQTLQELYKEQGIESTSCRFFTAYGPRAKINHAVISFIARTFIQQPKYEIWGDGTQIRNWTHVDDIVEGLMISADLVGCNVLNLGTIERTTVKMAIEQSVALSNELYYNGEYQPKITYDITKPTGPLNRVSDNSRFVNLMGKEPKPFYIGLEETMKWFYECHSREFVRQNFERLLIERK